MKRKNLHETPIYQTIKTPIHQSRVKVPYNHKKIYYSSVLCSTMVLSPTKTKKNKIKETNTNKIKTKRTKINQIISMSQIQSFNLFLTQIRPTNSKLRTIQAL